MFTNKPKTVPYNYQYNRYQLKDLSISILDNQKRLSSKTYSKIIDKVSPETVGRLIKLLRKFPDDSVLIRNMLIREISTQKTDPSVIKFLNIYYDLFGVDDKIKPVLTNLSKSANNAISIHSMYLLAKNGHVDRADLPKLINLYNVENISLRNKIIETVGNIGEDTVEVRDFFKKTYQNSPAQIKAAIIETIGKIKSKDPELVEVVLSAFEDNFDGKLHMASSEALKELELSDKEQLKRLKKVCKEYDGVYEEGYGMFKVKAAKKIIEVQKENILAKQDGCLRKVLFKLLN